MTSNFNTTISLMADDLTTSIFNSIKIDNEFYPENITKTSISLSNNILNIYIEAQYIQHFRASINTLLRLIKVSHDSIKSVKIYEK